VTFLISFPSFFISSGIKISFCCLSGSTWQSKPFWGWL